MTAQQLKNSILQYAVQGKLVPQNPTDEPAALLLKRIRAEKKQLIKDKVIRAEKPLPEITADEIPFDIPESWEWVRLGDITLINPRNKIADDLDVSFIPMTLINDGYGNFHTSEKRKWATIKSGFMHFKENDIAIAKITPSFENRKSAVLKNLINGYGAGTTEIHIIRPLSNTIVREYLLFFLKTEVFISNGVKAFRGTAGQQRIGKEYVSEALIPLPPLAEQDRIVAKIDELMPWVEEYGKAEQELSELNSRFPEQIKKSVLQYAIQGKLTAQDPSDEPASKLLKRIQAEKKQLIKEKKIPKENPLPPITEEEIPFDIPESWEWVRLGEVTKKLTDGTHHTPKYTESGVHFLSVKDMSGGYLDFSNTRFISKEEHDVLFKRCNPEKGDLLLTKVGTTGIPVIVDTDKEFSLFVSVALIKFNSDCINSKFLVHLINSPLVQIQCTNSTKGVGNKNWVMRDIANTIIALPPLAEQERIVAKVEEVLGVCEGL